MPKRLTPLAMQIKLLESAIRADKAERRAAEAPLRAARTVLKDRLRKLKCNLAKAEASRVRMLSPVYIASEESARYAYGQRWRDNVASIVRFTADIASTELDLAIFNEVHPELPT